MRGGRREAKPWATGGCLGSLCPGRAAVGKGPPMGITRVCLTSEEEGWSWTGRSEMRLQLTSLLGKQAESGWQECLGDSDDTEQGGFRSQIRCAISLELITCLI